MLVELDRPVDAQTLDGLVGKFLTVSYAAMTPAVKAQEMFNVVSQLSDMRDNVPVTLRDEYTATVHKLNDSFDIHIDNTKDENKGAYDLVATKLANIDLTF